jgi:hypothetical protein
MTRPLRTPLTAQSTDAHNRRNRTAAACRTDAQKADERIRIADNAKLRIKATNLAE